MDQYYEQNVVNNNIDERTKRTKSLIVAKTVCLIIGVFILVSSATLISFFWVFILFSIPFFLSSFVLGRINKRNNTEYDYVIDDENIRISEIYFREKRKLKHTIRLRLVESVGVFDSEGYKKVERLATKKILALVNYEDEDSIIYILYNTDKGKKIIFLEPDRGFMIALRRAVSAMTVFDKSIADFEKRLNEKAAQLASTEPSQVSDDDGDTDKETDTDDDSVESENEKGDETA